MKKYSSTLLSILAGILLIILAYRFDLWSYHLRPSVSEFDFSPGEQAAWMLPAYRLALAVDKGRAWTMLGSRKKLEARKILENAAESHTSGARFVRRSAHIIRTR